MKGCEFYTSSNIVKTIAVILKPFKTAAFTKTRLKIQYKLMLPDHRSFGFTCTCINRSYE